MPREGKGLGPTATALLSVSLLVGGARPALGQPEAVAETQAAEPEEDEGACVNIELLYATSYVFRGLNQFQYASQLDPNMLLAPGISWSIADAGHVAEREGERSAVGCRLWGFGCWRSAVGERSGAQAVFRASTKACVAGAPPRASSRSQARMAECGTRLAPMFRTPSSHARCGQLCRAG